MSKNWYCIIQGRDDDNYYWKQIIKDLIIAPTKKEARKIVEEGYLTTLPMRMRKEDLTNSSFLLSLYEIPNEGDYSFLNDFFKVRECEECGKSYRNVDQWNINNGRHYNEFCSINCKDNYRMKNFQKFSDWNVCPAVIYKIEQISTGKVYIGKTIRSFTLRWWEHLKSCDKDNKFHKELSSTPLTDWNFSIVEEVVSKDSNDPINILERETYWMKHFDSIENGFNSVVSCKENTNNKEN